ncbi:MAG: hypothetical protein JST91_07465 [Actinobacteria bacterium]|nr:hypothetical protein [Actinomycetota bacterium]
MVALGTAACDSPQPTPSSRAGTLAPTTSSAAAATPTVQPESVDYSRLLLTAGDLSDAEDTFSVRSQSQNPNGMPGASALFVNADDTRAIADTFVVYPDGATATATLRQAAATINTIVAGGEPRPSSVGTDGTVISGTSPDGTKAVTLLLFTQGPALVRLEFDSAPGDTTTDQFVTAIGTMQKVALRIGLPDTE